MGEPNDVQGENEATDGLTPQAGANDTSENENGSTSKEPVDITKTPEFIKAVSDELTLRGRKYGDLTKREKAIQEAEERRAKETEERELEELESVRDKPEELSLLQKKQSVAKTIRAFNAEKSQVQPILDTLKEFDITDADELRKLISETKETGFNATISEVSAKHKVDATVLKTKAERLGLKDRVLIDELASTMYKTTEIKSVDSGKSSGGGGKSFADMTPQEKMAYGEKHPDAKMK